MDICDDEEIKNVFNKLKDLNIEHLFSEHFDSVNL